jgi:hypothetical protein
MKVCVSSFPNDKTTHIRSEQCEHGSSLLIICAPLRFFLQCMPVHYCDKKYALIVILKKKHCLLCLLCAIMVGHKHKGCSRFLVTRTIEQ